MSTVNIKNKGDYGVWGDLNHVVDRAAYGGQALVGMIWPSNPNTGFEGTIIPCNDFDGRNYRYHWCLYTDRDMAELDRRLDEGYDFVQVNPNDPTEPADTSGNKWNFRLPKARAHRVTSAGHVRCELGEAMYIPVDTWLELDARRNPSRYAQDKIKQGEAEIHNLAAQHGFGTTRTQGGVTEEVVKPI